jgi:uncharacterized repeat protein (TIGR02059 family)
MVAQALRFKLFGWYSPKVSNFGATVVGAALVVPITGGVPVAGAVTPSQFTCLVNGASRAVSAATVVGQNCNLTLASAVTTGQTVTVSYSGGGAAPLKDAAGNLTPAFTVAVQNNT